MSKKDREDYDLHGSALKQIMKEMCCKHGVSHFCAQDIMHYFFIYNTVGTNGHSVPVYIFWGGITGSAKNTEIWVILELRPDWIAMIIMILMDFGTLCTNRCNTSPSGPIFPHARLKPG